MPVSNEPWFFSFSPIKMSRTLYYVKCLDPETNKIYYFNKRSHEVLYSCPSGLETEDSENLVQSDDETMCNYVC